MLALEVVNVMKNTLYILKNSTSIQRDGIKWNPVYRGTLNAHKMWSMFLDQDF